MARNKRANALPLAVRVYPEPRKASMNLRNKPKHWRRSNRMLVFDTETRTDPTQSLIFGAYRYLDNGECLEEGLFYADDISEAERGVLEKYVSERSADVTTRNSRKLLLLTRAQFIDKFFQAGYKVRCLLVGFNLPFDLSRIAFDVAPARGRFAGGFSLGLGSYLDDQGCERRDQYRPRIGIKHIDSKRALKGFMARNRPDTVDLSPEDSVNGRPEPGFIFRGHFLDLRTLAFVLTDKGHSLETACKAFGVENEKVKASSHGILSEAYIDYNRRDVQATSELAHKLLAEYDRNPVTLQVTKAYSPASLGKSYLREMGITPILQRQPDFPKHLLGYAQSAFFGGRTSAHIRKVSVPVVYTDFLSMYPTVNSLMNLWRFVTARKITFIEHCDEDIIQFINQLKLERLFLPATWRNFAAFVKVIPNGDILPKRSN